MYIRGVMGRLILLVGKTSSGKDTIARYIKDAYGISQIVSYTTRPKRPSETNWLEHIFVTKKEMSDILATQNILAYTEFNDTQYCTTTKQLEGTDKVYIIDPNGIGYMKEKGISAVIIYVDLDESIIVSRALKRGDDIHAVRTRLKNEREQFDDFKRRKLYDFKVDTNCDFHEVLASVDSILNTSGFSKI